MTAKIASLYFAPVYAERPLFTMKPYQMPAVPLGEKPAILEVKDQEQKWTGPYSLGQGGKRLQQRQTIPGETIAADLVNAWTVGGVSMNPQCHPGIWLVRERVPLVHGEKANSADPEPGTPQLDADNKQLFREATSEEAAAFWAEDMAAAREADQAYARTLYDEAEVMANDPKGSRERFIQQPAKLGVRQYGFDADWASGKPAEPKTCEFCTKRIPKKAIVCPFCREIVDATAYGMAQVRRDREIKDAAKKQPVAA